MATRERALLNGDPVTILEGKVGKRGKCKIRTAYGYEEEVPAKDLTKLDKDDPLAKFNYEDA
jgi:hypothetical protein